MPRRVRKTTQNDNIQSKNGGATPSDQAMSARIQTIFKKILATLQNQRDLRCDLSSTRTRAVLLDSELSVLQNDYEKSLAAHDKLAALSKELARQNKAIDEEAEQRVAHERKMREEIVHRFNHAMMDINSKLSRQSCSREQREQYVAKLQRRVADLRERYDMRAQHFALQLHRKKLETQLAEARRRELSERHSTKTVPLLTDLRQQLASAQQEYDEANSKLIQYRDDIRTSDALLSETADKYATQKTQIARLHADVKQMQSANTAARNANDTTQVHMKAMLAECARLETAIAECMQVEQRERNKVDTLDSLCRKVTCERSELHSEIVVMQEAWTKLKQEIDSLKDQVGDSGKVFDVLQSIMNRESLDVAVTTILKSGKSFEDVINDEISNLRLTAGIKLNGKRSASPSGATSRSTAASATRSAEAPG